MDSVLHPAPVITSKRFERVMNSASALTSVTHGASHSGAVAGKTRDDRFARASDVACAPTVTTREKIRVRSFLENEPCVPRPRERDDVVKRDPNKTPTRLSAPTNPETTPSPRHTATADIAPAVAARRTEPTANARGASASATPGGCVYPYACAYDVCHKDERCAESAPFSTTK